MLSRRGCILGALVVLPLVEEALGEPLAALEVISPTLLRAEAGRTLRLAGIASALPEHEAPHAAAVRALSDLIEGQALLLRPDKPGRDRLGRELVQACRQNDGLCLQGRLLLWGHARVDPFTAPLETLQEFLALEAAAREGAAGLWSHPAYGLRSSDPVDLLPWIGSLQVFEGVVAAVGGGRGDIYLNFGEDWDSDTTARIARRHLRRFKAAGIEPDSLLGRRVRLRGWLQSWNGPFLELHSPGQVELLSDPLSAAGWLTPPATDRGRPRHAWKEQGAFFSGRGFPVGGPVPWRRPASCRGLPGCGRPPAGDAAR